MELDRDRPHFKTTNTNTSELFICFTSSSSMKLTTKSIFSPARGSLSSLSRRNGSLKGGASPFFSSKKRDQENQEPSSPKVTCIGQVRVLKTKKKNKNKKVIRQQSRNLSNSQNHRWAHLPISICEALKAIGAEFSCLFPCKSPCFVRGKGFTKWLVSVNEGGRRREIEVVVDNGNCNGNDGGYEIKKRHHVFDDLEVEDIIDEKGRVSVCVPPKNALLLMRCRSDPMKVAALTSRFTWDDASKPQHGNEEDLDEFERECEGKDEIFSKIEQDLVESSEEENEIPVEEEEAGDFEEEVVIITSKGEEMVECGEDELKREISKENNEEMFVREEEEEEEVESNMSSFEALLEHQENTEQNYEDGSIQETDTNKIGHLSSCSESQEEDNESREFDDDDENQLKTDPEEDTDQKHEEIVANKFLEEIKNESEKEKENQEQQVLPDCLLLMMREPKLSMEVSKETWVCTNDFIKWLPQRPPKKSHCHHAPVKRALSMESKPEKIVANQAEAPLVQLPRWSCSLPPKPSSMATMIEQKLVNAAAYEPFVLTRCKSEPMRTASAKLVLEPHRRATVGKAGVGF